MFFDDFSKCFFPIIFDLPPPSRYDFQSKMAPYHQFFQKKRLQGAQMAAQGAPRRLLEAPLRFLLATQGGPWNLLGVLGVSSATLLWANFTHRKSKCANSHDFSTFCQVKVQSDLHKSHFYLHKCRAGCLLCR